jgi:hypothetical protein
MVAALYVQADGIYSTIPGVEPWGLPGRDAREYAGPWPVVAHPPCAAWGRYAKPTPDSVARGPLRGEDGGCFTAALASVRRWGGVLEHPRDSKAWVAHGLGRPGARGWTRILAGGWTCLVEQGHYGHKAQKPTWLYWSGQGEPPALIWGPSTVAPHPTSARRGVLETMGKRGRAATPLDFAKMLVRLAESA